MGIRLLVLDDNPHVTWQGRVYPVNATFHRFLAAILEVPGPGGAPLIASIAHAVPLRPAERPPWTAALDERLRVVATAPFDGIAGFLRRAPAITRRNHPILREALERADLIWIKVPASNAPLAAWLAARAGVPRFVYVAGRASDVVAGQRRGRMEGLAARAVARLYDGAGWLVAIGGERVVVGEGLAGGRGVATSLVEPDEVRPPPATWPRDPGRLRLVWAGRLAPGKGIETLLEAVVRVPGTSVDVLGDGPARAAQEALARRLGLGGRVSFAGYVADRASYLERLARADAFVFPSPAEGLPKAVLDAMAAGLPVLAAPAGALAELARSDLLGAVPARDPGAVAAAVRALAADPPVALRLAQRGSAFARAHTRAAEAARLVARWQAAFPQLPWT